MIYAALRGNQLTNNTIFDRNSPLNRDNCFAPYALLREEFLREGVEINTVDRLGANKIQFEIHQDVQNKTIAPINYLLMFENELVKIENTQTEKLAKYKKIFTWNDSMVDGVRVLKINFPNPITIHKGDGFRFYTQIELK
jgi:alpha(1,3/1,4) fucosyltransferase